MTREYYGSPGNDTKSASISQRGDTWVMYGYDGDDELSGGRQE